MKKPIEKLKIVDMDDIKNVLKSEDSKTEDLAFFGGMFAIQEKLNEIIDAVNKLALTKKANG